MGKTDDSESVGFKLTKAQLAVAVKGRVRHRLGEVLAETVNHKGSMGVGDTMSPTIPDGISKMESSRTQQLAMIPWEEIEQRIGIDQKTVGNFVSSFGKNGSSAEFPKTDDSETAGFKLTKAQLAVAVKGRVRHRLGEVLAETVKHGGDRKSSGHDVHLNGRIPEGIEPKESSRTQQLAMIPWEEIEQRIETATEILVFPTMVTLMNQSPPPSLTRCYFTGFGRLAVFGKNQSPPPSLTRCYISDTSVRKTNTPRNQSPPPSLTRCYGFAQFGRLAVLGESVTAAVAHPLLRSPFQPHSPFCLPPPSARAYLFSWP